jgi:hypothetical protein
MQLSFSLKFNDDNTENLYREKYLDEKYISL